jgi:hypothetical protein
VNYKWPISDTKSKNFVLHKCSGNILAVVFGLILKKIPEQKKTYPKTFRQEFLAKSFINLLF